MRCWILGEGWAAKLATKRLAVSQIATFAEVFIDHRLVLNSVIVSKIGGFAHICKMQASDTRLRVLLLSTVHPATDPRIVGKIANKKRRHCPLPEWSCAFQALSHVVCDSRGMECVR